MKTPTLEEMNRPRTEAEADAAILRISAGTVRRCIPAQVDDDDVTLGWVVEDWKRLRALFPAAARPLPDPCGTCANLASDSRGRPECLVPRAGGEILRGEALPLGRTCAAYRQGVQHGA